MPISDENKGRFASQIKKTNGASPVEQLGRGIAAGLASDPFVELAMSTVASEETIDKAQGLADNVGATAGTAKFLTEMATLISPGVVAHKAGAKLGRAALKAGGRALGTPTRSIVRGMDDMGPIKRISERLRHESVIESARDKIPALNALGHRMTPDRALKEGFIDATEHTGLKKLGFQGNRAIVGKSGFGLGGHGGFTRTAETVAANASLATLEGGREGLRAIFEEENMDDAMRHAALVFVLGAGFEGGLTAIGRLNRIPADLGLLRQLPQSAQKKLAKMVGQSGDEPLKVRSMRNAAGFAPKELTRPQFDKAQRATNKGIKKTFSMHGDTEKAVEAMDTSIAKMNELAASGSFSLRPGLNAKTIPGELTIDRVRKMLKKDDRDFFVEGDFFELTKRELPVPGLTKKGTPLVKDQKKIAAEAMKVTKATQQLNKALRQEKLVDDMLKKNPMIGWFDDMPIFDSSGEAVLSKAMLQIAVTPEGVAPRLGLAASRIVNRFRDLNIDQARTHQESVAVASAFAARTAKTLGLSPKDVHPDRGHESFVAIHEAYEKFGGKIDDFVEVLQETVLKQGGKHLDESEALSLHKVWSEMEDIANNGFSREMLVEGMPVQRKILEGFEDLLPLDPSLKRIDKARMAKMLGTTPEQARYMPQVALRLPKDQLQAFVAKSLDEKEFAQYMSSYSRHRSGLPFAGSLDRSRSLPGSLKGKLDRGLPMQPNPFKSWQQYVHQINNRSQLGKLVGFTTQEKQITRARMREIVGKENSRFNAHGKKIIDDHSGEMMDGIFDAATHSSWDEEANRKLASILTSWNIASKLPLGVIPNMAQSVQTATFNGIGATIRGFKRSVGREPNDIVNNAIASSEQMLDVFSIAHGDGLFHDPGLGSMLANALRMSADGVLKWTQFSRVEAFNRVTAANAGLERAMELTMRAGQLVPDGKRTLMGAQLTKARRHSRSLGFSLDDIASKMQRGGFVEINGKTVPKWLTTEEGTTWAMRTAFRAAETTQFVPNALRKPLFWDTPTGRVIFQFKTFALQQFRFIRDQIGREVADGNTDPLLYFMGMAPVAGEIVGDIKNVFKEGDLQRNEHGAARFVNNILMVGGAGILSDLWRSAQYEQLLESASGPSVSDGIGILEQLARGNYDGVIRDFGRQPGAQVARTFTQTIIGAGYPTVEWIGGKLEVLGDSNDGPVGITRGELQMQDSARKREQR